MAKALYEAGFFSLYAPRAVGGPEADFRTAFEVYRILGRGCGSSAWNAMVLSGGAYVAALFGARAREEVWGCGSARSGGHQVGAHHTASRACAPPHVHTHHTGG